MKKVLNSIMKFFSWFAITKWWTFWSNIRFRKSVRHSVDLMEEDKVSTVQDIKSLSRRIYKKFRYTEDGADQLWDAITPPPQNYLHYIENIVEDDCDGFHSTMYHCLSNSGIECYLLSITGIGSGHCLLIFKLNDLWHAIDYNTVYRGYDSIMESIDVYKTEYRSKYNYNKDFLYCALVKYDYSKGKFIGLSVKETESE